MSEQEQPSLPEDPPVTIAEDEVDRLLAQAQDLANDISSTAGSESAKPDPDKAPETPVDDERDPLASAEAVDEALGQLAELVDDAQPDGEAPQTTAPPVTKEARPDASDPSSETRSAAAQSETSGIHIDESELIDADVRCDLGDDLNVDLAEPGERAAVQGGDGPRVSWRQRLGEVRSIKSVLPKLPGMAVALAGRGVSSMLTTILRPLVVLDRPFAGLSPAMKRRIGHVALVTLLMGLVSFVLPTMCDHNPYQDMQP